MRDSAVETLGAVLRDDPSKYPETSKIPAELQPLLFRCLAKDPADRYQSALDLLLDLRAWQAEIVQQSARRVTFRSVPPWQQRRTRVYLRAAGGAVLFPVSGCWPGPAGNAHAPTILHRLPPRTPRQPRP